MHPLFLALLSCITHGKPLLLWPILLLVQKFFSFPMQGLYGSNFSARKEAVSLKRDMGMQGHEGVTRCFKNRNRTSPSWFRVWLHCTSPLSHLVSSNFLMSAIFRNYSFPVDYRDKSGKANNEPIKDSFETASMPFAFYIPYPDAPEAQAHNRLRRLTGAKLHEKKLIPY